ncbi:MAG: dockerin type I repeat-containing protein [Clostridia bacterium]|nr:dockerin type I repeat-containing protein [Clostridia bacterium]
MKAKRILSAILASLILLSTFCLSVSAAADNRSQLAELIREAEQGPAPGGNYNPATVSALMDALDEARLVYVNPEATDEELLEQIDKLDDAIHNLESYNFYKTGFWNALQYVAALNPEDFTEESYNALYEIYLENNIIVYYPRSQEELDEATKALNEGIANLVPVGDATAPVETAKDKLIRFVNRAEHYIYDYKTIYSDASIKKLSDAYNYGISLIENSSSSDKDLNFATENIENAINGLVIYTWDNHNLDLAMKTARKFQRVSEYFTEESYEKFSAAYRNAETVKYSAQSQKEVDIATLNLINATSELEPIENPTTPVETAESRYRKLLFDARQYLRVNADNYTEVSCRALFNVINTVNAIEFRNGVSDEEYNNASDMLEEGIANLEFKPAETDTEPVATTATEIYTTSVTATENTSTVTEPAETTAPTAATFDEPEETTVIPCSTETIPEITTEPQEVTTSTEADTTPTETVNLYSYYILGDADQSSKISIKDATAIQKHIAKLTELSQTGMISADANEDGKLNIKDATEIQKHLANLPSNKNIGKEFVTDAIPIETTALVYKAFA